MATNSYRYQKITTDGGEVTIDNETMPVSGDANYTTAMISDSEGKCVQGPILSTQDTSSLFIATKPSTTSGIDNTLVIGTNSGTALNGTSGCDKNLIAGIQCAQNFVNGSDNVFLGYNVVYSDIGGNDSVIVGSQATGQISTNELVVIGKGANGRLSGAIAIGKGAATRGLGAITVGRNSGQSADHDYNITIGDGITNNAIGGHIMLGDAGTNNTSLQIGAVKSSIAGNQMMIVDESGNISNIASQSLFGRATLVTGTVTVSTSAVNAQAIIMLTRSTAGGTLGHLSIGTITDDTSFVINSSDSSDTSVITWVIVGYETAPE